MKLFEISSRVDPNILREIALALEEVTGNYWEAAGASYGVLQKYFKHPATQPFMYTGKMYRIFLKHGAYNEFTSNEIRKFFGGRKLFSFAKTLDGLEHWFEQLGDYETSETATITEQTGTGYDVQKVYRYVRQFSDVDILQATGSRSKKDALFNLRRAGGTHTRDEFGTYDHHQPPVLEVVAPVYNNIKVIDSQSFEIEDWDDDDDDEDY